MLLLLDYLFVVVHSVLVAFNLSGWIWRSTRRLHLISISLTLASWTLLGLLYGWGYCPCTDWHWDVKRALGKVDLPASYVKYYLDLWTGTSWDPLVVDVLVAALGVMAFMVSILVNVRDWRRRSPSDARGR